MTYINRFITFIKQSTLIVVIAIGFVIAVDFVISKANVIYENNLINTKIAADTYKNQDWVSDYFKEFSHKNLRWESYTYWRRLPFKGKFINVDSKGLRKTWSAEGTEVEKVKKYFFGGSTMWGTGVRDNFTIPSLVAKELYFKHKKIINSVNFGETGYVSTQSLIALQSQLRSGNVPDIVIFYDGVNDVFSAFQARLAGIPQNEYNRVNEFNLFASPGTLFEKLGSFLVPAIKSSWLFFVAKGASPLSKAATLPLPVNLSNETVSQYLQNIKMLKSLGKEYGFTVHAFWQPVIYEKNKVTNYEQSQIDKMGESVKSFYKKTYSLMNNLKDKNITNISKIFKDDNKPLFIDYCHLGDEGNKKVSEVMAQRIITDLN